MKKNLKSCLINSPLYRLLLYVRSSFQYFLIKLLGFYPVFNYFSKLDKQVSYNYVARLILDPICRYPVERFYSLSKEQ